jgi:hypothetical protein
MGTFAETVIVDCHLYFADQEKQTSVFCFLFPYIYTHICTDNVTIYMYVHIYTNIYLYIYIYTHIHICCLFKRKTESQAIFLNSYTACSSCKWKFAVCCWRKNERKLSILQTVCGLFPCFEPVPNKQNQPPTTRNKQKQKPKRNYLSSSNCIWY